MQNVFPLLPSLLLNPNDRPRAVLFFSALTYRNPPGHTVDPKEATTVIRREAVCGQTAFLFEVHRSPNIEANALLYAQVWYFASRLAPLN